MNRPAHLLLTCLIAVAAFNPAEPCSVFPPAAPHSRIYLYAHANPVMNVDPSGKSIGSSIESVIVSAIQNGLQGFKNASTIIVKRQIIRKLASEVGEEVLAEGVYFLIFQSPYGLQAYVGQSDDVLRRIGDWEDWAKKAGKHVSEYSVHVVGYVQVFMKDQYLDRTKKFVRELVEQGMLDMIRRDPSFKDDPDLIRNHNNPVRKSTAVERFERHFHTPEMKKKFKQLFKKVFPG